MSQEISSPGRHTVLRHIVLAVATAFAASTVQTAFAQSNAKAAAPPPPICDPSGAVNYEDHEVTVYSLRLLYQSERFAQLETALNCLLESPQTFQSGRLGSSAVYWLYRRALPAPGLTDQAAATVKAWQQQRPKSIYAELASLRLLYATAWKVRGSSYSRDVSKQRMETFAQELLAAERAMKQASPELRDTPMWHNLLLATVLDSQLTTTRAQDVLSTALHRWPKYYDFYEVALSRMVPKWGGSWASVDRFIVEQSSIRRKEEGNSLYARLYWNVIWNDGASPKETALSWPRMKSSLDSLIQLYPHPVHMNIAASFACAYGDLPYAKKIKKRLPSSELLPPVWVTGTDPDSCPGWSDSNN